MLYLILKCKFDLVVNLKMLRLKTLHNSINLCFAILIINVLKMTGKRSCLIFRSSYFGPAHR